MKQLTIDKLTFLRGQCPVVDNASLSVTGGELVGLIGPNGAGKTTLLKSLAGLLKPAAGDMRLDGRALSELSDESRARQIAYLAQERTAHWPISVERIVALGRFPHLAPWQQPGEADLAAIEQAMRETDVLQHRTRQITHLSGGEQMRVLLARALAVRAPLMLVDEPVAALDPAHAIAVMQTLRRNAEAGNAVIAVLHDLTLAARFCHRLALMHRGRIVASGSAASVLSAANLREVYGIGLWDPDQGEMPVIPWQLSTS
ncbi:ABC transporter ATP-binding protein [Granulosicoccaceae sp. 1_MG-2023]|nr:ABC transporter ATP-binding protein [Granulosicoccaceae sp. 1_MG-2023]